VNHIVSAIKDRHRALGLANPVDETVRETLAGIARDTDQEPGGKDALTRAQLRRVLDRLGDSLIEVRDRAMILVGFTTGWRSCELAALWLREVHFHEDHMRFRLRRSKSDQLGKGRDVRVPRIPESSLCPVAALEAWVKVRGANPGSLFLPFKRARRIPEHHGRVGPQVIRHVLQRHLERAGIKEGNWGAHSLRSGMITAAPLGSGGAGGRAVDDGPNARSANTGWDLSTPSRLRAPRFAACAVHLLGSHFRRICCALREPAALVLRGYDKRDLNGRRRRSAKIEP
jgi:integrase